MAHDIHCDTFEKGEFDGVVCEQGTPATTYIVWRWSDETGYTSEHLCDECLADLKSAGEFRVDHGMPGIIVVWQQSCDYLFDFGGLS